MSDKIHIKTTFFHKIIFYLCLTLLIGTFVYLFIVWNQLPQKIPAHYNGAGQINRWGSKFELFITPFISVFMFLGISITEKYPDAWNTGVTITEENQERVYIEIKNMIVITKFIMVLTFTFITVNSSMIKTLPSWFLPVDMALIFGSMGYFIYRIIRAGRKIK